MGTLGECGCLRAALSPWSYSALSPAWRRLATMDPAAAARLLNEPQRGLVELYALA